MLERTGERISGPQAIYGYLYVWEVWEENIYPQPSKGASVFGRIGERMSDPQTLGR